MNRPQINAIVYLDPMRLGVNLAPLEPRQLHSFVMLLHGIPSDVTSVVVRVFKIDQTSHFDIPVSRRPDGSGAAYIIGTCFPDTGSSFYEVHAYDARGNMTALGRGGVWIHGFSQSSEPIQPGASVPMTQIPDESGAMHLIRAVHDGKNWTYIVY